jgi:chloramphenicol 3-O phosphotransferase
VVDGEIRRGPVCRSVYEVFQHSVAAFCRGGQNVIIDDVLIDGGTDQARWKLSLTDIETIWIGVHCDREVVIARESERGDRPVGIAERYSECVHQGVIYDIDVSTSALSVEDTVDNVKRMLRERWGVSSRAQGHVRDALPPRSALSADRSRSLAPWER